MLWEKFIENGIALMPLDAYPYSEKCGWVVGKYGLSWKVMYMGNLEIKQKITPTIMFVWDQFGEAEEAIELYTSIFENSKVSHLIRYGEDDAPNKAGTVQQLELHLKTKPLQLWIVPMTTILLLMRPFHLL